MNRSKAPSVKPFSRLVMPPEVVELLPNGVTLHIADGGGQPVTRFKIVFCGGVDEFRNNYTPQLTLENLTNGSAGCPTEEMADLLDFNGVRTSSGVSLHHSILTVTVLNNRLEAVFPLLADILQNPAFPDDYISNDVEMARADMRAQKQAVKTPASIAFRRLMRGENHPTVNILEESEFDGFAHDAAADIYRRLLCPGRIHVYMAGKLDESVIEGARRTFGSLTGTGAGAETELMPYRPVSEPRRIRLENTDKMQSAVVMGAPVVDFTHPDFPNVELVNAALGGYFGSRLMSNIREKNALTYGISSYVKTSRDGSYMAISATCDHKFADRLVDEVNAELRRLVSDPPCGEELRCLKTYVMSMYARLLDTPYSRLNYYIRRQTDGLPAGFFARQCEAVRNLTPEIISATAAGYFAPERMSVVISGE